MTTARALTAARDVALTIASLALAAMAVEELRPATSAAARKPKPYTPAPYGWLVVVNGPERTTVLRPATQEEEGLSVQADDLGHDGYFAITEDGYLLPNDPAWRNVGLRYGTKLVRIDCADAAASTL